MGLCLTFILLLIYHVLVRLRQSLALQLCSMKTFTNQDVENYYDHTEPHYRMWWELDETMGLHYGIWSEGTKNIKEAIINTNRELMKLGNLQATDVVLDAGCGVGGSSIFMAKELGCKVTGITLSKRQVATATNYANQHGVSELVQFAQKDYTNTGFEAASFDVIWAIESMQTAQDKGLFLKEAQRILKPGGRIVIADCFKPRPYAIALEPDMLTMLNGWAISDILTVGELERMANRYSFQLEDQRVVTQEIKPSVRRIYWAAMAGMLGTKAYNLVYNATHFSKIHYKTGLAQYKTYKKGLWDYCLVVLEKTK